MKIVRWIFEGLIVALVVMLAMTIVWYVSMPNCERDWMPQLERIQACMDHPKCKVTSMELEIALRLRNKIELQCNVETGETK